MKFKIVFIILYLFILSTILAGTVRAEDLVLPENLQNIVIANQQLTSDFFVKVSFFLAFVAGILTILSPCILPLFPVYFSYLAKEKKNITKMTLIFSAGFSLAFVIMGTIVGVIGEQSLSVIQDDWLMTIIGLFIIILGFLSLLGKGISSFIKLKHRPKNDIPGTFLLGLFFAIGWTACLGPILGGILGIGAILHNVWYSALLLLSYSLGNLIPLILLSIFYDKLNFSQSRLIQGRLFTFYIGERKFYVHSTNLISGLLLIIVGSFIAIYKGTSLINKYDIFKTRDYFYLLQNKLIEWQYANIFGVLIFFSFVIILWKILLKKKKKK